MTKAEQRHKTATSLLALYESRRLTGDKAKYEPDWIHPGEEDFALYVQGKVTDKEMLACIEERLDGLKGWQRPSFFMHPLFGPRIVHEAFKVGSPSWVFLGRNLPSTRLEMFGDEHVICGRATPDEVRLVARKHGLEVLVDQTWIGYSKTDRMGDTAMTANVYGPCNSLAELIADLKEDRKTLRGVRIQTRRRRP